MTQRIGLVEALCGFQITVAHLDGRQLLVKSPPGKVIEPGTRPFLLMYEEYMVPCTYDVVEL
jgi:hypothetical protein